jgi:hypothetical protein
MRLLARFRVALGWMCAPLVFILADPTPASIVAGSLVALVGEGIRFWAAGHLHKSSEVTTSGPYRYFSHPLYVGSSVMGAGLGLASANPIALGIVVAYLVVTLRAAIASEVAFLRGKFGDEYENYRRGDTVGDRGRDPGVIDRPFSFAKRWPTANIAPLSASSPRWRCWRSKRPMGYDGMFGG